MTALPNLPRVPLKRMDPSMLVFELHREADRLLTRADGELITSAATMASFLHRNQTRFVRGDLARVPYIEHPLRVALRLIRWGVTDPELIAAALLHDVVEDCADELLQIFGEAEDQNDPVRCLQRLYRSQIARYVETVTNPKQGTYEEHIDTIAWLASPALLIKASDLKDNAGSIKHQLGHGKDEKMLRLLRKYLPVIPMVAEGLVDTPQVAHPKFDYATPAATARHELHQLHTDLLELADAHGVSH